MARTGTEPILQPCPGRGHICTPTQPWRIAFRIAPLENAATEPRQLHSAPYSPAGPPSLPLQDEESEASNSHRVHPMAHPVGSSPALKHTLWPHHTGDLNRDLEQPAIPAYGTSNHRAQPKIWVSLGSGVETFGLCARLGIVNERRCCIWERKHGFGGATSFLPGKHPVGWDGEKGAQGNGVWGLLKERGAAGSSMLATGSFPNVHPIPGGEVLTSEEVPLGRFGIQRPAGSLFPDGTRPLIFLR